MTSESNHHQYDDDDSWGSDDSGNDEDNDIVETLTFYPLSHRTRDEGVRAASFSSLADAIQHDVDQYGFNILTFLPSASDEDFFEKTIVIINKCREHVNRLSEDGDGGDLGRKLSEHLKETTSRDNEEVFFRPVLPDDAMLMSIDELQILIQQQDEGINGTNGEDGVADKMNENENCSSSLMAMQVRISALEEQLERAKACICSLTMEDESTATSQVINKKKNVDNDSYYFFSYSHHDIHETMLQDQVRTNAYQEAITTNAEALFRDKVVLDIGCGTGILSLFCCKAGAKRVIAMDGSDILQQARAIARDNGYESKITFVQGKVENLITKGEISSLLNENEKVDMIVSEWMGYALLFETMLPSVLLARDGLGGTIYPNKSSIFLEGARDDRLQYWDNVYGINMGAMKDRVSKELRNEASVEIVQPESIVTNRVELIAFDLNSCQDADLDFCVPFELQTTSSYDDSDVQQIDKLVVSFDVDFNLPETNPVRFSTGCQNKPTHWKQTTLWFDAGEVTLQNNVEILKGTFQMGRNVKNHREMDFLVQWEVGRKQGDGGFVVRTSGTLKTILSA